MRFKEFADRLEGLEGTTSRIKITDFLAALIGELGAEEVDKGVYLLLGQLAPEYKSIEFNMADKMVVRAIAAAAGVSGDEVMRIFKEEGDLGKVVKKMNFGEDKSLTVDEVYRWLKKVAEDEGGGSQERKVELLAELLKQLDSVSGKFVVRTILSKLRLGFSYKTILDALSVFTCGDKRDRGKLELAYQVLPDVGLLAKRVKLEGVEKTVSSVKPILGVPIASMLAQRLKSPAEMIKKMGRVAVEPKFDGTRVEIHFRRGEAVRTFTRNMKETSFMFPELKDMEKWVSANELILDSEAVGLDEERKAMADFQTTMTRRRKHEIGDFVTKVPIKFYVFDVMFKDGESLMSRTYTERREVLAQSVMNGDLFQVDNYEITDDPETITKLHRQMLDEGLEGIIVKKANSEYVPGRTGWRWVKMKEVEKSVAKLTDTVDVVVMGYSVGQGKRAAFGIGRFLVGIRDGEKIKTVTKIGTGLSDDQFRELKRRLDRVVVSEKPGEYEVEKTLTPDVWVEPSVVVEVGADEIIKSPKHSAGWALRFPRLVRFRDDKDIEGVTTLNELRQIRKE